MKVRSLGVLFLVMLKLTFGFQSSSESKNPFNQFMAPSGGVNLYSGDAMISYPMLSLPGRNGMNVDLSLAYSSNVTVNARADNTVAPTGWCGLGWAMNFGSIKSNHNGTVTHTDDGFVWMSPQGVPSKISPPSRLQYKYYEFEGWTTMPDDFGTPVESGTCSHFNVKRLKSAEGVERTTNFAFIFEGKIRLDYDGVYTFYVASDDGVKLYIDNVLVVDNDPAQPLVEVSAQTSSLTAGYHTIKVKYVQKTGPYELFVKYEHAQIAKQRIPAAKLFHPLAEDDGYKRLYIENAPYAKCEPKDSDGDGVYDGWMITQTDGSRYHYGNMGFGESRKATRYTFSSGNFVGNVTAGTPKKYPYQWDLSRIEDVYGNTIDFWYQQEEEAVHSKEYDENTNAWVEFKSEELDPPLYYTKASYLRKIRNPEGAEIRFVLQEKRKQLESQAREPVDPKPFVAEPDGFMELFETQRLHMVQVFQPGTSSPNTTYVLEYAYLNPTSPQGYLKSLLKSIETHAGNLEELRSRTVFTYYDDPTKADSYLADYHFGGLKSIEDALTGGKTVYQYTKKEFGDVSSMHKNCLLSGNEGCSFACGDGIHGTKGVRVHGGTYGDGEEYMIVQGGNKSDRIWMYTFDGHKWELNPDFKCKVYGAYGEKEIACGHNFFVYKDAGRTENNIQIVFWHNGEWLVNSISIHDQEGDDIDVSYVGNDFIVFRGGDGDNYQDRIWVYRRFEGEWVLDDQLRRLRLGESTEAKTICTGNNFFAVKDKGSKEVVWILRWNGHSWDMETLPKPPANHAYTGLWAGSNYVVLRGGTGDHRKDQIWLYYWNGANWVIDENIDGIRFGDPDDPGQIYSDKVIVPGNGYFVIRRDGGTNHQVWIVTWSGREWTVKRVDPANDNELYTAVYPGPDYVVLRGGDGDVLDRLRLYHLRNGVWEKKIDWDLPEYEGESIRDAFNVACLKNTFGLVTTGVSSGPLYQQVYMFDGQEWETVLNRRLHNFAIGTASGPRNTVSQTHSSFGFAATRYSEKEAQEYDIHFVHKYQDRFNAIFNYVVSQKMVYSSPSDLATTHQFDYFDSHYDANAGIPKFNRVEVSIPGEYGKSVSYFFNDSEADGQDQIANYERMDGMSYKTAVQDEANTEVSGSTTEYYLRRYAYWPDDVFEKRTVVQSATKDGVTNTTTNITFSDYGFPKFSTVYSDAGNTGTLIRYAYEEYPEMAEEHMVSQPCQQAFYEQGDGWEPRRSTVTAWSNEILNDTWTPSATLVWTAEPDANGDFPALSDYWEDPDVWLEQKRIHSYSDYGTPTSISDASGLSSVTILGRSRYRPIATVTNSTVDECAVFTCDYDLDPTNPYGAFDNVNGWWKGKDSDRTDGVSTISRSLPHFGDYSVHVKNAWGPTKNVEVDYQKDYVFSAWVRGNPEGSSNYVKFAVEFHNAVPAGGTTRVGGWDTVITSLSSDRWTFVEHTLRKDGLGNHVSGSFAPNDIAYFRIWIGNTAQDPSADFYVDDIRFHPRDARVTSTYYDSKWEKTILSVDANNNPSPLRNLDRLGRPAQIWKIDKTKSANEQGFFVKLLQVNEFSLDGDPARLWVNHFEGNDVLFADYQNSGLNVSERSAPGEGLGPQQIANRLVLNPSELNAGDRAVLSIPPDGMSWNDVTVRGYFKAAKGVFAYCKINVFETESGPLDYHRLLLYGTGEWTRFEVPFSASSNTVSKCEFVVDGDGGGETELFFDEFEVLIPESYAEVYLNHLDGSRPKFEICASPAPAGWASSIETTTGLGADKSCNLLTLPNEDADDACLKDAEFPDLTGKKGKIRGFFKAPVAAGIWISLRYMEDGLDKLYATEKAEGSGDWQTFSIEFDFTQKTMNDWWLRLRRSAGTDPVYRIDEIAVLVH